MKINVRFDLECGHFAGLSLTLGGDGRHELFLASEGRHARKSLRTTIRLFHYEAKSIQVR